MQTPLHARPKNVRDLFRARPASRQKANRKASLEEDKKIIEDIDRAHKAFWKRRGFSKPPRVSKTAAFDFDTPA
jgi:hypothetical protein